MDPYVSAQQQRDHREVSLRGGDVQRRHPRREVHEPLMLHEGPDEHRRNEGSIQFKTTPVLVRFCWSEVVETFESWDATPDAPADEVGAVRQKRSHSLLVLCERGVVQRRPSKCIQAHDVPTGERGGRGGPGAQSAKRERVVKQ